MKPVRHATTRRHWMQHAGAGLAAVAAGGWAGAAPAQARGAIKIGVTLPLSGTAGVLGQEELLGAQVAVRQVNAQGGVLGRPLELVVRDDKANPTDGVVNLREFAAGGANLVLGGVQTSIVLAAKPLLKDLGLVFISIAATADELTTKDFTLNYFRITDYSESRYRAQARFLAQRFADVDTWVALVPDAAFGDSAFNAFVAALKEFYPPLAKREPKFLDPVKFRFGATDFRNQAALLMQSPASGLFAICNGADAINFYSQAAPFGVFRKFKLLVDAGNDIVVPKALGTRTPPGFWTTSHWHHASYAGSPIATSLYEAAKAANKGDPHISGYVEPAHAAVLAYAAAIRKAGSTDTARIIAALESTPIETAKGRVIFRKSDHQAITDVNLFRADPKEGAPGGFVITESARVDGTDLLR